MGSSGYHRPHKKLSGIAMYYCITLYEMKLFTLELCNKQKGSTWYQIVDFIPSERNGKVF